MALEAGFRKFDTAEADWWYDQKSVGSALNDYFGNAVVEDDECVATPEDNTCGTPKTCGAEDLRVSTKIPPWSLPVKRIFVIMPELVEMNWSVFVIRMRTAAPFQWMSTISMHPSVGKAGTLDVTTLLPH